MRSIKRRGPPGPTSRTKIATNSIAHNIKLVNRVTDAQAAVTLFLWSGQTRQRVNDWVVWGVPVWRANARPMSPKGARKHVRWRRGRRPRGRGAEVRSASSQERLPLSAALREAELHSTFARSIVHGPYLATIFS